MQLKLPGRVKVVLWLSLPFLAWWAFETDAILEPFLLFLTIGMVPGTQIKLSPDTILTALPFVFAAIVGLILHRDLWHLGAWIIRLAMRRPAPQAEPAEAEIAQEARDMTPEPSLAAVEPLPEPIAILAPTEPKQLSPLWLKTSAALAAAKIRLIQVTVQLQPAAKRFRRQLRKHNHRLLIALIPHLDRAAYGIGYGLGWLKCHGLLAWMHTTKLARVSWRFIRTGVRYLLNTFVQYSVSFWRWLSPYLWELDAWLGARLEDLLRSAYVRQARQVLRDLKYDIIRLFKK